MWCLNKKEEKKKNQNPAIKLVSLFITALREPHTTNLDQKKKKQKQNRILLCCPRKHDARKH